MSSLSFLHNYYVSPFNLRLYSIDVPAKFRNDPYKRKDLYITNVSVRVTEIKVHLVKGIQQIAEFRKDSDDFYEDALFYSFAELAGVKFDIMTSSNSFYIHLHRPPSDSEYLQMRMLHKNVPTYM